LGRVLFDDVDDLLSPPPNLALIAPFEHHPQERLGARIPDEQPTAAGQLGLD